MTRTPDAEVAVVGLGAWGSSALWQLASRGVRVLGFERYGLGHPFGASHGGTRMFRVTCLEHPGLVPLAKRSGSCGSSWRPSPAVPSSTGWAPS